MKIASFKGINNILPVFTIFFRPIWIQFGTEIAHQNLFSNCEFRENRM
jgi:hypothetical protein